MINSPDGIDMKAEGFHWDPSHQGYARWTHARTGITALRQPFMTDDQWKQHICSKIEEARQTTEPAMIHKSLTELREEMRAVARGERRAAALPAAPVLAVEPPHPKEVTKDFADMNRRLGMEQETCTRCGEVLNTDKIVWLELSTRSGIYTSKGHSEAESQGWFPFGSACAQQTDGKRLKKIRKTRDGV